jgi:hypothetical protein
MRLVPSASAARGKIKQAQAARESKTLKSGFIFDLVFWVPISQGRIGRMRPLETCYTKPLLFGELTQVTLITISSLLAVVSLARFMILAKKNARNRPIHPMHKYDSSVVGLGGGPATIRQYLQAGLVDHIHLAVSPVLLGSGESLLAGINLLELGYKISEHVSSPAALHVVLTKQTSSNAASTSKETKP